MPSGSAGQPPPRVLVLWDIDHTLIECLGFGRVVYERAFKAAFGKELGQLAELWGRTELDIMAETLRVNGVEPADEAIAELSRALVAGFEAARDELMGKGRVLPGARETLVLLAEDPRLYQSVLTGNLRDVARIKVEVFGLAPYLDLDAGAYGEDDHNRALLVHHAQQRARAATGEVFTNSRTVLIGDTPNDIRAGKAAGVRVIGVATGKSSADELRKAGAEQVLADLTDAEQVRDALLYPARSAHPANSESTVR